MYLNYNKLVYSISCERILRGMDSPLRWKVGELDFVVVSAQQLQPFFLGRHLPKVFKDAPVDMSCACAV